MKVMMTVIGDDGATATTPLMLLLCGDAGGPREIAEAITAEIRDGRGELAIATDDSGDTIEIGWPRQG